MLYMKRIAIRLTEHEYEDLRWLCGERDMTVARLIERLLSQEIKKWREDRTEASEGAGATDPPRLSLLQYLCKNRRDIQEVIDLAGDIDDGYAELHEYLADTERYDARDVEQLEKDLDVWEKKFHEIISAYEEKTPDFDRDWEIAHLINWVEVMDAFGYPLKKK